MAPIPHFNIVGVHSIYDALYVQAKAPPGKEAAAVASTKAAVIEWGPGFNEDNVVVYAVKYNFAELWRWAKLLDRFVLAAANPMMAIPDLPLRPHYLPIAFGLRNRAIAL